MPMVGEDMQKQEYTCASVLIIKWYNYLKELFDIID